MHIIIIYTIRICMYVHAIVYTKYEKFTVFCILTHLRMWGNNF